MIPASYARPWGLLRSEAVGAACLALVGSFPGPITNMAFLAVAVIWPVSPVMDAIDHGELEWKFSLPFPVAFGVGIYASVALSYSYLHFEPEYDLAVILLSVTAVSTAMFLVVLAWTRAVPSVKELAIAAVLFGAAGGVLSWRGVAAGLVVTLAYGLVTHAAIASALQGFRPADAELVASPRSSVLPDDWPQEASRPDREGPAGVVYQLWFDGERFRSALYAPEDTSDERIRALLALFPGTLEGLRSARDKLVHVLVMGSEGDGVSCHYGPMSAPRSHQRSLVTFLRLAGGDVASRSGETGTPATREGGL